MPETETEKNSFERRHSHSNKRIPDDAVEGQPSNERKTETTTATAVKTLEGEGVKFELVRKSEPIGVIMDQLRKEGKTGAQRKQSFVMEKTGFSCPRHRRGRRFC